jgi:hypothetical protein
MKVVADSDGCLLAVLAMLSGPASGQERRGGERRAGAGLRRPVLVHRDDAESQRPRGVGGRGSPQAQRRAGADRRTPRHRHAAGPRERSSYKPQIEEETESAWVKVRERVPSPGLSPVLAVSGATECVIGDQLRSVGRDVVYPTRNPWFSGDVAELSGALVSLINTSERAVTGVAVLLLRNLFSCPASTPALGGTEARLQRGLRRPDSAVRRARISGGARWAARIFR